MAKLLIVGEGRPKISLALKAIFGQGNEYADVPTDAEKKEIQELLKQVNIQNLEDEVSNEGKKKRKNGNFGSSLKVELNEKTQVGNKEVRKDVSRADDLIK